MNKEWSIQETVLRWNVLRQPGSQFGQSYWATHLLIYVITCLFICQSVHLHLPSKRCLCILFICFPIWPKSRLVGIVQNVVVVGFGEPFHDTILITRVQEMQLRQQKASKRQFKWMACSILSSTASKWMRLKHKHSSNFIPRNQYLWSRKLWMNHPDS